jgi:hypothetical protein
VYWKCSKCGTSNILQDVEWCPGCHTPRTKKAEKESYGDGDEADTNEDPEKEVEGYAKGS